MSEYRLNVGACYYPAKGEVDLWWWGDESEACLEGIKVTPSQGERIAKTVPPCVQMPAITGNLPDELRPCVEDVPVDEALATMVHVMQVGWKPFFNGQRISDCIASVKRLARLGAAIEAMPKGWTLEREDWTNNGWNCHSGHIETVLQPTAQEALDDMAIIIKSRSRARTP